MPAGPIAVRSPRQAPWSTPKLGCLPGTSQQYLELDFGSSTLLPGQSSSGGTGGGEKTRLYLGDWANRWSEANDYSAASKLSSGSWRKTDRVELYDTQGNLIYGWNVVR